MERRAKAATCLSGTRVPLVAQTARRPMFARAAVAPGTATGSACAPRSGTATSRRSRATSSVFVSRVSPNPRPTLCFSWPEQDGCCGSAGRLPFDLLAFCLPVVRWKARHGPTSRKDSASCSPTASAMSLLTRRVELGQVGGSLWQIVAKNRYGSAVPLGWAASLHFFPPSLPPTRTSGAAMPWGG